MRATGCCVQMRGQSYVPAVPMPRADTILTSGCPAGRVSATGVACITKCKCCGTPMPSMTLGNYAANDASMRYGSGVVQPDFTDRLHKSKLNRPDCESWPAAAWDNLQHT